MCANIRQKHSKWTEEQITRKALQKTVKARGWCKQCQEPMCRVHKIVHAPCTITKPHVVFEVEDNDDDDGDGNHFNDYEEDHQIVFEDFGDDEGVEDYE
jgi:hypothetical protein